MKGLERLPPLMTFMVVAGIIGATAQVGGSIIGAVLLAAGVVAVSAAFLGKLK